MALSWTLKEEIIEWTWKDHGTERSLPMGLIPGGTKGEKMEMEDRAFQGVPAIPTSQKSIKHQKIQTCSLPGKVTEKLS